MTNNKQSSLPGRPDGPAGQLAPDNGPSDSLHPGDSPSPPASSQTAPADAVDLALENRALAAENLQLKAAAQSQRLGKVIGELRFLGKLTPGLEQAGAVQLLQAAYGAGPGLNVNQADGSLMQLGDALVNLLYAIPPSWSGEGFGYAQANGRSHSLATPPGRAFPSTDWDAPLPRRLSAEEREVARSLGLTPEEYAGIVS